MKNSLLVMLIALISFTSYSQIKFEPGYFIDNNGNQHEVLIRNLDARNSTTTEK